MKIMTVARPCFLALAAAIPMSATAQADGRWEYLGQGSSGTLVSLDTQTIDRKPGLTLAWVRFTYLGSPPPGHPPAAAYTNIRFTFQCEEALSGIIYSSSAGKNGETLDTDSSLTSPTPIVPDSIAEVIWRRVCKDS